MNTTILPDNILTKMSPEARKALGVAGKTAAECEAALQDTSERKLQSDMVNLLNQKGLFFNRSAFHKRSTGKVGFPDYCIWFKGGSSILVEAKTEKGKLSTEQEQVHQEFYEKTGKKVTVIRDLQTFKTLLDLHIALAENP